MGVPDFRNKALQAFGISDLRPSPKFRRFKFALLTSIRVRDFGTSASRVLGCELLGPKDILLLILLILRVEIVLAAFPLESHRFEGLGSY